MVTIMLITSVIMPVVDDEYHADNDDDDHYADNDDHLPPSVEAG